jgi:Na+/pantothenate symporter
VAAFPTLAERTLAPFWQGLFTVGLLAAIMSTVDSYTFICGITVGRDIVQRWGAPRGADSGTGPLAEDGISLRPIRWGLLATAVLAVVLALWAGSVVRLWHDLGSIGTPVLLLPLALGHGRAAPRGRWVPAAMALSGGTALAWLLLGRGRPFLGVESIFPGLAVSLLVLLPGWLRRRADA